MTVCCSSWRTGFSYSVWIYRQYGVGRSCALCSVILLSCYPAFVILRVILFSSLGGHVPRYRNAPASLHANESIHSGPSALPGINSGCVFSRPSLHYYSCLTGPTGLSLILRVIREWPQRIPNSPSSSACRSPEGTLWILLLQVPFASLSCGREEDVLTGPCRLSGMRPRIRLCGMFCPGCREVMTQIVCVFLRPWRVYWPLLTRSRESAVCSQK